MTIVGGSMRSELLVASIAVCLGGSSALAADIYTPAPTAAPVMEAPLAFDWTGAYLGLQAGYGSADFDYAFPEDTYFNTEAGQSFGHDAGGFVGGVFVGVLWQTGNWVFGLDGALQYADLNDTTISPYYPDEDIFTSEVNWLATLTPKVGFAVDRWLVYAKGGLAVAEVRSRVDQVGTDNYFDREDTLTGWTVGAGIDYAMTDRVTIGIEAAYVDLGDIDLVGDTPGTEITNHSVDTDMFTVSARISYRFWTGTAPGY